MNRTETAVDAKSTPSVEQMPIARKEERPATKLRLEELEAREAPRYEFAVALQ